MTIDYLAHLRSESDRFGEVLADTDPAAPVPTCPDWTAADLLWHLAEVQLFWGAIVRDRLDDPDAAEAGKPERPADYAELLALYRDASAALIDALAEHRRRRRGLDVVRRPTRPSASSAAARPTRRSSTGSTPSSTAGARSPTSIPRWPPTACSRCSTGCSAASPGGPSTGLDGPVGRLATTDTGARVVGPARPLERAQPEHRQDLHRRAVADPDRPSGEPSFTISGTARDLDAWLWNRPTSGRDRRRRATPAAFEAVIRRRRAVAAGCGPPAGSASAIRPMRRVVHRRVDEPRLERARRQVDPGVEHARGRTACSGTVSAAWAPAKSTHRLVGEEHREQVAGVLHLVGDPGLVERGAGQRRRSCGRCASSAA